MSFRVYRGNDVWEEVGLDQVLQQIMLNKSQGKPKDDGITKKNEEYPEPCEVTKAEVFNFYGGSSAVNALMFYKGSQNVQNVVFYIHQNLYLVQR